MNLIYFTNTYPNEESWKLKFKEIREKHGVTCPRCGGTEHYWKWDQWQYECKNCKTRTTLRSGTIMHNSKLPFQYWFIAIHLLTSARKSFSAKEVQRQLGHKLYQPVWEMLYKLRSAMGSRDERYQLASQIDLHEGFFSSITAKEEKDKPLKRGWGSQRKTKVFAKSESRVVEGKTTKKGKPRRVGFIQMQVIENLEADTITPILEEKVSKDAVLDTDDFPSYVKLKSVINEYNPKVSPTEMVGEALPWIHLTINNAKKMLLNMYHDVNPAFLQNYLNEFCYKFNRRYYGEALFERLLTVSVSNKNSFRYNRG